jgi:formamidopyrimidine-DNA glycosylase
MTDYQRNARIKLNPEISPVPDALSPEANLRFWKETLQSRATIKNLLIDQKVVRGIGNAYADEILWHAGISPFSIANKIPAPKVRKLAGSIKKVLKHAVQQIRKADPGIIGGEIRSFLSIHQAKKTHSPSGAIIQIKSSGGRKTYYTKEQKLYS